MVCSCVTGIELLCTPSLDEGIDRKHFVTLFYISVDIKASLLKFSMFNIHKILFLACFLFFLTLKLLI